MESRTEGVWIWQRERVYITKFCAGVLFIGNSSAIVKLLQIYNKVEIIHYDFY